MPWLLSACLSYEAASHTTFLSYQGAFLAKRSGHWLHMDICNTFIMWSISALQLSVLEGEREYFILSLFFPSFLALLLSQLQLSSYLLLAALSAPDLRPFPRHRNSMLALAVRIRNRGKLGIGSDSSEVVGILSLQLHGGQEWIKVLSNLCVWHHWLISYYKIKCYLKISATVKASLPLPVLNWDFKSGTMYTGYFSWHVYQY